MRLEDQVVSLELAKRLKELGAKQESAFYWESLGDYNVTKVARLTDAEDPEGLLAFRIASAFTVAELGEMLPPAYHSWQFIDEGSSPEKWTCAQFSEPEFDNSGSHWEMAANEADVRARMLCYLLENNLMPHEQKK